MAIRPAQRFRFNLNGKENMNHFLTPQEQDAIIAGGLISSPAWASWLSDVNLVLTTITLLVGLLLGATRLWRAYMRRKPSE